MLGAIAGDIIGSAWEASGQKSKDFPLFSEYSRFTDDTVMTVAVAHALLDGLSYPDVMREFGRSHPFAGFGKSFQDWLNDESMGPYNSLGNGGAMRVSAIGFLAPTIESAVAEAERCASFTHDHPEGMRGARAVALAIFLARNGVAKDAIRSKVSEMSRYSLHQSIDEIRPGYGFDVSAEHSVPQAIVCFLDASDFEDAIRNAVSLGGDADTMACIAGAIAEAYWRGVPDHIAGQVRLRLPPDFLGVVDRFYTRLATHDVAAGEIPYPS